MAVGIVRYTEPEGSSCGQATTIKTEELKTSGERRVSKGIQELKYVRLLFLLSYT